jgi:outer membrane protein assembly factor BamB
MVVLQCDHYGDSYLIALDQKTGAARWKTDRPGAWLSWSSPQLVEVKDEAEGNGAAKSRHELVVCGSLRVDAYDPTSGSHLWTVGGMQRECIPTPVVAHGRVYVVSGPGGQSMAIRPGGSGDVTRSHVLWSSPRGVPYVPSAIVVGDYYYLIDDEGIGTCLSTKDGSRVWQKRFSGQYTASPVAGDGKIYFINEAGDTTVIAANVNGYRELARSALGEPVYASPAISGGQLFIRGAKHLYCVGAK